MYTVEAMYTHWKRTVIHKRKLSLINWNWLIDIWNILVSYLQRNAPTGLHYSVCLCVNYNEAQLLPPEANSSRLAISYQHHTHLYNRINNQVKTFTYYISNVSLFRFADQLLIVSEHTGTLLDGTVLTFEQISISFGRKHCQPIRIQFVGRMEGLTQPNAVAIILIVQAQPTEQRKHRRHWSS